MSDKTTWNETIEDEHDGLFGPDPRTTWSELEAAAYADQVVAKARRFGQYTTPGKLHELLTEAWLAGYNEEGP